MTRFTIQLLLTASITSHEAVLTTKFGLIHNRIDLLFTTQTRC